MQDQVETSIAGQSRHARGGLCTIPGEHRRSCRWSWSRRRIVPACLPFLHPRASVGPAISGDVLSVPCFLGNHRKSSRPGSMVERQPNWRRIETEPVRHLFRAVRRTRDSDALASGSGKNHWNPRSVRGSSYLAQIIAIAVRDRQYMGLRPICARRITRVRIDIYPGQPA